ncbi:hypothetical protein RND81_06G081200 [Saponaria officinalis]|uniref:GRF-type domain-containing protein n=1 Tax=Saponaria officinalis TaxID=3572 RepID=A0AAW1K7E0_SAPOF
MSRESYSTSSFRPSKCRCGVSLALLKSWTSENPGRRFLACKLYNPETNYRGCNFFKWYDKGQFEWQEDVIDKLMLEKKLLEARMEVEKASNLRLENRINKLMEENELMRVKAVQLAASNVGKQKKWCSLTIYGKMKALV